MMDDGTPLGPDLSHPDAAIRLASVVHRFRCPEMGSKKLAYAASFKTSSSNHTNTRDLMRKADDSRGSLLEALAGSRSDSSSTSLTSAVSHESVANAARAYVPYVNQVLLSCKVQPDTARLDERLLFQWSSGIEIMKQRKTFKSEALMYELVMTIACEGLGVAGMACDESTAGDFRAAAKQFKVAAGVFEFLAQDQLPKWMARGSSVDPKDLPSEVTPGTCEALKLMFLASAQQMAVATVLVKPGTPNYTLVAKLCLGIAEQIDQAVGTFRSKAAIQMPLIDETFFTLLAFQSTFQRGLSLYFLARAEWDASEYGVAIALLQEAASMLQTRDSPTGKGLPETDKKSGLAPISADLSTFRTHLNAVLQSWQKDNSTIYYERVPRPVPEEKKLAQGMTMMKPEKYMLDDVEPVPLSIPQVGLKPPAPSAPVPAAPMQRTDSDLARELQAKLDAGEDI